MGIFARLHSKLANPQPRELPVRYGLGPPPRVEPELCPLCQGQVTDHRWVGHFSTFDGGGGSLEQARCSACDTVLRRGGLCTLAPPGWRADTPAPDRLLGPVVEAEIERLTELFGGHRAFDTQWSDFLANRRPGDEVWRFARPDGFSGYAVVRQGRPLAQFLDPVEELMKALA